MSTLPYAPRPKRNACPTCLALFRRNFVRCPLDGTELEVVDRDPLIGQELADGRYEIEAAIGEGGMGRVYRAKHTRMSRRFAVKVLYGDLAADQTMRARFSREAEVASRLDHPNLVSVVDFGETSRGLLYLVMSYVDGILLTELILKSGALATDRAMDLFRQMATGLEHAHGKGLIHRDFKPDNVMVAATPDGEIAKILDFGIARLQDDTGRAPGKPLTTLGALMGTPAFMSPEQAAGREVDQRTDLFSLGVTLYELATGLLPFDGDAMGILRQNMALDPPPMHERVPGLLVDPRLEAITRKLMAKSPDHRYQSARDVIRDIDEWWIPPRARRASASSGGVPRFAEAPSSQPSLPRPGIEQDDFENAATWDAAAGTDNHTTLFEQDTTVEDTPARVHPRHTRRRRRMAVAGMVIAGAALIAMIWTVLSPASNRDESGLPNVAGPIGSPATRAIEDPARAAGSPVDRPVAAVDIGQEERPPGAASGTSNESPAAPEDKNTALVANPAVEPGDQAGQRGATASGADRRESRPRRGDHPRDTAGPGDPARDPARGASTGNTANAAGAASPPVATALSPPPVKEVEPVTREQYIQKYDAVYGKLEAFRKSHPRSPSLPDFDATFRKVDRLNISDRAYSTLQSLSARIDEARQEEPRGQ